MPTLTENEFKCVAHNINTIHAWIVEPVDSSFETVLSSLAIRVRGQVELGIIANAG